MALKAPRFAGNARLQAVANNSPTMKWGEQGEAVKLVQQAYIDLGFAMPISTKKSGSPDGIFGNETYSVTKAFQKKHKLSDDGIVGRDTMGKLDELFTPATPPPPPRLPRFEPTKEKNGFDNTTNPPWQMVPVNGRKRVRLMNGDGLDVVSVSPTIAKVEEVNQCFVHGGREFIITGLLKGMAFIQARQGNKVFAQLQVGVKQHVTVTITFHFVKDNAGHHTIRNPVHVDDWVSKANEILLPQANVEIKKHAVRPNVQIDQDLGDVVRFSSHLPGVPASEHEWDIVTAKGDSTAGLNVFFVWEYEQDATPNTDHTAAGTSGGNCIFEDHISRQTHDTLAHEVGHHLGADHSTDGLDLLMSPGRTDTRINRDQVNTMNP